MQIVKVAPCPGCQYSIRVSVKRLPKGLYTVAFFDGHDKNARAKTTQCPRCKTDLFQSGILKTLTGLETAQLSS
jgi:hypothetical protein